MDLAAYFEDLMQRSPIPQHEMTSFLREMRRTPSGTVTVSKLLAAKIQSLSEAQAIHAFDFLESALQSETEGSIEFRTEIGRYRFLNEIIRILSPKYLAEKTPEAVKERAIKFLEDAAGAKRKRWFPSEHSKVNSVYQSLVESGIIQKPTRVADEDAEFQKSIFERGENAVILKRLLQSKDPSDLQAANRLIKNLVDEEARRNERRAELHSLIDRIETSTGLLTEMLNQPKIDKEIVDELVDTCRSLRQKLGGVATETNDEATSLLHASENIEQVLMLYDSKKDSIARIQTSEIEEEDEEDPSDEASAKPNNPVSSTELSLADQLLMSLGDEKIIGVIQQSQQAKQLLTSKALTGDEENLLLNLDIDLSPPSGLPKSELMGSRKNSKPEVLEPFDEISKLSKEMMEQSLKGIQPNSSHLKKTDKTPLSQIKRPSKELHLKDPLLPEQLMITQQKASPQPANQLQDSMTFLDLDFLDKSSTSAAIRAAPSSSTNRNVKGPGEPQPRLNLSEDENLLLVLENEKSKESSCTVNTACNGNVNNNSNSQTTHTPSPKPLENENKNDSNGVSSKSNSSNQDSPEFCLNSVRELDLEKIDLFDDLKPVELTLEDSCKDVNLNLTFGKYPGFPGSVSVAVVTFVNRSKASGLLNYVFQLMPPKGLQVKLLAPACMELPPWKKTFLPPPILTQVALIRIPKQNSASQTQIQPKIKYILSFCVEDETVLQSGDFSIPSYLIQ